MTVIRTLPVVFTGGNSALLPLLPYSLGVAQPKYRWLAGPAPVGAVTSVAATVGTVPLTGTATVTTTATGNVLTTNGTTNYLTAVGVNDVRTVMIVGRVTAATGTAQGIANANFGLSTSAADGKARLAAAGFTTQFLSPLLNDAGDHVIIVSTDGATLTYRIDAVTGSAATTTAAGVLEVGRTSLAGALYGAMTIREVVGWSGALTAAEMTTLRTKAKANYSTITA